MTRLTRDVADVSKRVRLERLAGTWLLTTDVIACEVLPGAIRLRCLKNEDPRIGLGALGQRVAEWAALVGNDELARGISQVAGAHMTS